MKRIFIISIIVFICVVVVSNLIPWLFSEQYNENGISHFLVITIDKDQPKEYIGRLDNHDVYIQGLNIYETNFRSVNAENVSIKQAIDNKIVSINEWKKYAWKIKKVSNTEILKFENYEIAITKKECIIRPLTK